MNKAQLCVILGGGFYLAINLLFILWYNFVQMIRIKDPVACDQQEHARPNFGMIPQTHRQP